MATLHEILSPAVLLKLVSRTKPHQSRFSKWLGFQPKRFDPSTVTISGPNTRTGYGRNGSYRIFDSTRSVATFKSPATGPATTAQNPLGVVQFSYARAHEKMILDYESLGNLSPLIGPNSEIDANGENFIVKQTQHIAKKFNNAVSFMAAGLARTVFYLKNSGDDWIPTFTLPTAPTPWITIDYQVPSGNKSQLNMLGAGSIIDLTWANASATIVKHLMYIRAAYTQLHGHQLRHMWVSSPMWYNVLVNTEVRNTAGSAATPFAEYERVAETDMDGDPVSEYAAVLKADPTIMWHVTDEALVLEGTDPSYSAGTGTITKIIPDTNLFACPDVDSEWCEMAYGSEPVVDFAGGNVAVQRSGYYFWHKYVDQPSGVELIGLLNALPLLYVPKVVVYATPVF